jgi:hypothetical protein
MVQKEKGPEDFALLTRKERDWLLGKIQVSKTIERDLRYRIRKKIEILQNQELSLLVNNGFLESNEDKKQGQSNQCIATTNTCSVVTNDDGVVSNHDGSRWSSLVKIPLQTWQEIEGNRIQITDINTKVNGKKEKWAGSDLNQRTPPCQGGILTKLDHRPLIQLV